MRYVSHFLVLACLLTGFHAQLRAQFPFTPTGGNQQAGFLQAYPRSVFVQSCTKMALFNSIENDTHHLSTTPIRINDLWAHQQMGELVFSLPGVGKPIRAVANMPCRYPNGDYTWTGDAMDEVGRPIGHVAFIKKGKKQFGNITIGSRSFIIRDLNMEHDDDQVLVEINPSLVNTGCGADLHEDGTTHPPVVPDDGTIFNTPPGGCDAVISILVLYTQEVVDQGYDPEQLAINGMTDLNVALTESLIPNSNISAILAGVALLDGFTELVDGRDAVESLADYDNTTSLRDEYGADLVILFQTRDLTVRNPFTNEVIDLEGIAIGINDVANSNGTPDVDIAFSVIEARASSLTFAHEVGHLLGCRHLKEDDPHEYANANTFCVRYQTIPTNGGLMVCDEYRNTIMDGKLRNGLSRVLRFSNPDTTGNYLGYISGTEYHNNAQMIALTACDISEFGNQDEAFNFSAFSSGPTNIFHGNNAVFEYSSYYWGCLEGSVTYSWEISWDYGATYQVFSTGEDARVNGSNVPLNTPYGYIRFTATCSERTNAPFIHFLELKNWSAHNLIGDVGDGRASEMVVAKSFGAKKQREFESDDNQLFIYPNPASSVLHIGMRTLVEPPVVMRLISTQGVKYYLKEGATNYSDAVLSFDVNNIPPGFYVLELLSEKANFRSPLIITRK